MLKIVIANLLNKNTKYAGSSKIQGSSGMFNDGLMPWNG
jgi:hypothetical protein